MAKKINSTEAEKMIAKLYNISYDDVLAICTSTDSKMSTWYIIDAYNVGIPQEITINRPYIMWDNSYGKDKTLVFDELGNIK